jgi:DNA polymerase
MRHLSIDIETYSSVPIRDAGAYKYTESPDFEILLLAYSLDGAPVEIIDIAAGEIVPPWLIKALSSPEYIKHAYNAAFEFGCFERVYGGMVPSQWRCTMFHGLYCGYTAGLEATGAALGLPDELLKLSTGKALIRYFCVPCKPTKANGGRRRNYYYHDDEKWRQFKEYCAQDVITEMEIEKRLSAFPVPDWLQKQWETDLIINRRGVSVDMGFVSGAIQMSEAVRAELMKEASEISGLENPNSVTQLTGWLNEEMPDKEISDMRKATVSQLLERDDNADHVQRMLEIRQELSKTSTKKYHAIENCVCADGKIRGLLQFYGANRTGRWAGRLVQVQNLPRTYTEPLELARVLVREGKTDSLRLVYGDVFDTLSQLIRTALVASQGCKMISVDFSAIEARVISWLAQEEWRLEVFRSHGKIYEASAAQMFGVPIEKIVKGNPEYELRARGKVAELALGYQGGVGAIRQMDVGNKLADQSDEEVQELVNLWRRTNSKIRDLWYSMDDAAKSVVSTGGTETVNGLVLTREYDYAHDAHCMSIRLPSGRKLYYISPTITENRWGNPSIAYYGVNEKNKWGRIETYGGKLVENCVQAIARDLLADTIDRLEARGYPVIFHVHDEVIIDIPPKEGMLQEIIDIMSEPVSWAAGLPLGADGWVGDFYKKE